MNIHHETVVFERSFNAPPERLFRAYADPKERVAWSMPSPDDVMVIDSSEVRTGGTEVARCGTKDNLGWRMNVAYHLVTENRQITFTEELWDGDTLLTVALITFEFAGRAGGGTALKLTDQVTSFVGADAVSGHRHGYTQALVNLEKALEDG